MTGFRHRELAVAALRQRCKVGKDYLLPRRRPERGRLAAFTAATFVVVATGCQPPEVQIFANKQVVYYTTLGGDWLVPDGELRLSFYPQPPRKLTVDVDSPASNIELLFLPHDAKESWDSLGLGGCIDGHCAFSAPDVPTSVGVGYVYRGGARTYPIGNDLANANPGQPVAIKTLYMRAHGECEAAMPWMSLFAQVLAQAKTSVGVIVTDGIPIGYGVNFSKRVATSYLRQNFPGVRGRGGFGLYVQGRVHFSRFIADTSFRGRAIYDVTLSDKGLPRFSLYTQPLAYTYDCSGLCLGNSTVKGKVKTQLIDVAKTLNDTIEKCMQVPMTHKNIVIMPPGPCSSVANCARSPGDFLGKMAQQEFRTRGGDKQDHAMYNAMTDPENWDCAPVGDQCAALTHSQATTDNVCQLKLRATDLIPMPDEADLVWYPGGLGTAHPSAAQALYLALKNLGKTQSLLQLCSGDPKASTRRAFVKVVK